MKLYFIVGVSKCVLKSNAQEYKSRHIVDCTRGTKFWHLQLSELIVHPTLDLSKLIYSRKVKLLRVAKLKGKKKGYRQENS